MATKTKKPTKVSGEGGEVAVGRVSGEEKCAQNTLYDILKEVVKKLFKLNKKAY